MCGAPERLPPFGARTFSTVITTSDVNVSFFWNESNSFFAFDHEKTNDSFFFTFTKLKF
jgi:hypothetical protein